MLEVLPLLMMLASGPAPADGGRARLSPSAEAARLLSAPERRVRATEPRIAQLIDQGVRRSYTFAQLVQALHETDVIVYVEPTRNLPRMVDGHLFIVPRSDGQRYLRIQVRPDLHQNETISLIAHELRHAVEVGEAPGVTSETALAALYKRIGRAVPGARGRYDTKAAQETGRQVRRELGG
jgi:hypothetical protein